MVLWLCLNIQQILRISFCFNQFWDNYIININIPIFYRFLCCIKLFFCCILLSQAQNIDKSKSFEDQIKSIKKVKNLDEYYFINDFGDKEIHFKIFKLKLAHLSNIIDKKLFEQIFGHKFENLANKLINATNKDENQIIAKNINENKEKTLRRR